MTATPPYKQRITLNWRLILIHFLAYWFVAAALFTLAHLAFLPLIDIVRAARPDDTRSILQQLGKHYTNPLYVISYYLLAPGMAGIAGLALALVLGIRQCLRRRWPLLTTVIAWIAAFFSGHLIDKQVSLRFFRHTSALFNNNLLEFLITGMILGLISMLLFFSARSIRFIQAGQPDSNGHELSAAPSN